LGIHLGFVGSVSQGKGHPLMPLKKYLPACEYRFPGQSSHLCSWNALPESSPGHSQVLSPAVGSLSPVGPPWAEEELPQKLSNCTIGYSKKTAWLSEDCICLTDDL
jgi:hypothetical protein